MTYSFVVCLNAVNMYICIHTHSYILTYIHRYTHNTYIYTHTHTHTHVAMLKCAPNVVFFSVWLLQSASESSCPILILEFSSVFAALCSYVHCAVTCTVQLHTLCSYIHPFTCMCSFTSSQSSGCLQAYIRCMPRIMSTVTAL